MAFLLLLPLILVPIAEIAIFIEVGQAIGLGPTLLGIVATGVLGALLMRAQGLGTLARARTALARRELPVRELFDGVCILIGGVLLLTPGFLTDVVGLLFLLPPTRALLRALIWRRLLQRARTHVPNARRRGGAPVIDGEFHEVQPRGAPDPRLQRGPEHPDGQP